ncbi:hypothetical protein ACIBJD_16565 [Kitasatospora sp. NPDC050467]|uniref:class III lanthionine synthetase LanKC N-terminal domain-containing protein n=1 Tax=Kitasatospora sp. NPDC050467 TaxID=3364053 RepID=UPI0037B700A8
MRHHDAGGWSVKTDEPWYPVPSDGCRLRDQGWKPHPSATPLSAPTVLARAARVLAAEPAAFKCRAEPHGTLVVCG